jgi:kynurenine formamidase
VSTRSEFGPAASIPPEQRVRAAGLVREGRLYSLAKARFRGMPMFPGHPNFEVLSYRTPRGLKVAGDRPWGPVNEAGLGYMSELILATAHSGAHIDALAHMTVGEDDHWFGGGTAAADLGDFGPTYGDAQKLPALFTRGVLLDVAGWRGVDCLAKGEAVTAADLQAVAVAQEIDIERWDVVLVRTGYMSLWPDTERMARHRTPGPDLSAAAWLAERGVVATGSDTETYEVQPALDLGLPANPQPVHTHLLIERGIYLMESLDLEQIAADRVYEFCFVALPLKIRGATGSMIDPLAAV